MKTKIHLSAEELKNSDFRAFEIEIRLDDECKNGHDDFAITGSAWSKGNYKRNDPDMCGCVHDEILKLRPDLKILVDLHLCNSKGQPMYTVENGYYHLTKSTKETAMSYLRITSNEYDILKNSGDKLHFCLHLENLGIIERWQQEANEGIKLIESLTGEKYKDSTTKETFTPLTEEQRAEIHKKLDEGFYSPEEVNKRKNQAEEDKRQKLIAYLKEKASKDIQKINDELNVKLAVLAAGYSIDNFIYYNHTNKGVFNWLDYEKKITNEDLSNFLKVIDYTNLPKGILFELSTK